MMNLPPEKITAIINSLQGIESKNGVIYNIIKFTIILNFFFSYVNFTALLQFVQLCVRKTTIPHGLR